MNSDDLFAHLSTSRMLAAASRRIAADNPQVARELMDESRAILAMCEEDADQADLRAMGARLGAACEDAGDELRFQRFREHQRSLVPPPDAGPFAGPREEFAQENPPAPEPAGERVAAFVTQRWMQFWTGQMKESA